ncbi:MAG: ribosome biogenesis GTPase Der [SAR202 cluster bacterium Io17-Chloro-G6]|nr:MAG: ribosome biogenesis GTPase Der [SAR202 cluster bacterium Io17-Chloro-G6]
MSIPIVAIIGRPNVGKSSLFNRVIGRRHAIVSEVAGTTRDRLMADAWWDDYHFILLDTGGLESKPEGEIRQMVQEQAEMAIADADVIIFVTDVVEGMTPSDLTAADMLRRTDKPVVLAVNKVDNDLREFAAPEFYNLGMGEPEPISAFHNYGIYGLMERVTSYIQPEPPAPDDDTDELDETAPAYERGALNLAIVGRTNVGKSSLLNAILGQERSIVSTVAGTTRDALDTQITYNGRDIVVIDTAGIRRPGQVGKGIEKYSVIRAVGAVNRSDITLLVTDASELATGQDAHIAGLAWEICRGLIVVINKWDLFAEEGTRARFQAAATVRERLHFMPYVPICFTSALQGEGIKAVMDTAQDLWTERMRLVRSRDLQFMLADALASHQPPVVRKHRGQRVLINRLQQVGVNPPTFLFTVNDPELVHFTYQRYLENKIRDTFGFDRTHLKLVFKRK